jgi:anti-sigma regulatory factor (Ser/Thr protein kinase)
MVDGKVAPSRHLQLSVPPDPEQGRAVRGRIAAFARSAGVSDDDLTDLLIALGEALANAIEHSKTTAPIEVSAWVAGHDLIAQVVDHGSGFVMQPIGVATSREAILTERGRGLLIMSQCADVISVDSFPGRGTAITLSRHLRAS